MGHIMKRHPPMSPLHRAKQFMPFNALAGLDEALRAAEERNARRFSYGERSTCEIHTDSLPSEQSIPEDPQDTHTSGLW